MKNLLCISTLFLLLFFSNTVVAQDSKKNDIEAKIYLEYQEGFLRISGEAINNTSKVYQLRYELLVITKNENNRNSSQNKQSGSFTLPASGTKILSKTTISNNSHNHTIIKLHIFNMDKVVARDSLTFPF